MYSTFYSLLVTHSSIEFHSYLHFFDLCSRTKSLSLPNRRASSSSQALYFLSFQSKNIIAHQAKLAQQGQLLYHLLNPRFINMNQPPAQPPATNPTPPTLWQCHVCVNEGPIKYENQKECGTCSHPMCDDCKKDDDIPPPITTTEAALQRVHASRTARGMMMMHAQDPDIWQTAHPPRGGFTTTTTTSRRAHARQNSYKLSSRPNRPDPTGWWKCSECKMVNNPALSSGRCTSCTHIRCAYCTPVRR